MIAQVRRLSYQSADARYPDLNHLFECFNFGPNCAVNQEGFVDSIPDCGDLGEFAQFCVNFGLDCNPTPSGTITMACR